MKLYLPCCDDTVEVLFVFVLIGVNIQLILATPLTGTSRLSLAAAENNYNYYEPDGPGTYAFGYNIQESTNVQFRDEEKLANGTVTGSYGYVDPIGNIFMVRYIADQGGYRATVEEEKLSRRKKNLRK